LSVTSAGICVYSPTTARTSASFCAAYSSDFSIARLNRCTTSPFSAMYCLDAK
jgi:hypothetical protein